MANHLVVHQSAAKGLALLRPTQRFVVTTLGKSQRHGRHGQALTIEVGQDHLEARTFFADQVANGNPHPVKTDLCRVRTQPAHFFKRAATQSHRVTRHHQHGDAHRPFVLQIRAHRHRQPVGTHARGDKNLFAVNHIVVALTACRGLERRHISATTRFGDGQRGNLLSREHIGNHLPLQGSTAVAHHRWQTNVVAEQAGHQTTAAAMAGQCNRHRIAQAPRCGCAPKLLGVPHGQPAQIGRALVKRTRKLARLFPGLQIGLDLRLHKAAHSILDLRDVFLVNGI